MQEEYKFLAQAGYDSDYDDDYDDDNDDDDDDWRVFNSSFFIFRKLV